MPPAEAGEDSGARTTIVRQRSEDALGWERAARERAETAVAAETVRQADLDAELKRTAASIAAVERAEAISESSAGRCVCRGERLGDGKGGARHAKTERCVVPGTANLGHRLPYDF
eukprot:SAG31_NODE_567_length_14028_cov_4.022328_5_plen_116_part_00